MTKSKYLSPDFRCEILENHPYKNVIENILLTTLKSVDPITCVYNNIDSKNNELRIGDTSIELNEINKIFLCGFGKASQKMALGVLQKIPDLISGGCVITKHPDPMIEKQLQPKVQTRIAGHPVPTQASVNATNQLLEMIALSKPDVVLCLISGGGSALLTKPHERVGLAKLGQLTNELMMAGANIHEINTIRKHMDIIKGGGLLRLAAPASVISLILSDVVGDDVSVIASGPTATDSSTFNDALNVMRKYHMSETKFGDVYQFLNKGVAGKQKETLKADDPLSLRSQNIVVGSNTIAVKAANKIAKELGFKTKIIKLPLSGEARRVGKNLAKEFIRWANEDGQNNALCMIAGGETTVRVTGSGKGGRNQELVTAIGREISGMNNVCAISFATDGEDGPTNAAGGIVTGNSEQSAAQIGISTEKALLINDTYHYLEKIGSLLYTGATGTNVNDLVLIFRFPN